MTIYWFSIKSRQSSCGLCCNLKYPLGQCVSASRRVYPGGLNPWVCLHVFDMCHSPTASSSTSTVSCCPLAGLATALPSVYPRLLLLVPSDQLLGGRDRSPGGHVWPLSACLFLGGTLLSNSKFFQLGGGFNSSWYMSVYVQCHYCT